MKVVTIAMLLFISLDVFGQNVTKEDLEKEIKPLADKLKTLQSENHKLKTDIGIINSKLSNANKSIDSLRTQTAANDNAITQTNNKLGIKIQEAEKSSVEKISAVDQSLSKKSLYGIIGVLSAILISGLLYWLANKKQRLDRTDIEDQILKTKTSMIQEGAKLDVKLAEILETQLKLLQEERTTNSGVPKESTIDHTMPLKVADEITRINAYANTLDLNSQDAKALKSSVKRLTNTFKAAHYEIVDMLGQRYDDGLKVIVVNAISDSKLKPGEEIISRIIKPLVKYKGEQIQAAQVDITISEQS